MSRTNNTTYQQQVNVGTQTIPYTLTFANRKSVGITIRPNLSVNVRAPQGSTLDAVAQIMRQRAPWILRHLQKFARMSSKQPPSSHKKGTTYQFLGRHFPLRIEPLRDISRELVMLKHDEITIWVKEPKDNTRVEVLLEIWSRQQAKTIFARRMLKLFERFEDLPVQLPVLSIRTMRSRWGSCSTKGTITINVKLIHFDEALIDYVIMHELCHLIEHNHSKNYYALLSCMMPDWRERRQRLYELEMPA